MPQSAPIPQSPSPPTSGTNEKKAAIAGVCCSSLSASLALSLLPIELSTSSNLIDDPTFDYLAAAIGLAWLSGAILHAYRRNLSRKSGTSRSSIAAANLILLAIAPAVFFASLGLLAISREFSNNNFYFF